MNPSDPTSAAAQEAEVAQDRAEFPDEIARSEGGAVSPAFDSSVPTRVRASLRRVGLGLAVAIALVAGVRIYHAHELSRETEIALHEPLPVEVVVAAPAEHGRPVSLPGQTAAWFESTIYARVSGYVGRWVSDIGDHVRKGQVLATLETPELDAELVAARAQLRASQAQVSAREAELAFARTTNERWRDSPKGVVSDQEREAKQADFDGATARLYAARAQVALDAARVAQFSALAEFKNVTAPFDGTITERKVDVGNLVTAGSTSSTAPLYHISQTSPLRVFVEIPQSMAEEFRRPGMTVQVSSAAGGGSTRSGTVARTAAAISPLARTMRLEIDVANDHDAWVPGMYVNATFELGPQGMVTVPAAALVFRPDGPHVARVDAHGLVDFPRVEIRRDDGARLEVSGAVAAGDRLILNPSSRIQTGTRVSVAGTDQSPPAAGGRS